MLRILSQWFVGKLVEKEAIGRERKAVYLYGCELLLSTGITIISILIIGLLTKHMLQAVIFILFFMPIRTVASGYHADSYEKCFLLTNIIACLCIFPAVWLNRMVPLWGVWLIYLGAHAYIWFRGPFQSRKHPLKRERVEKNRLSMHRIQVAEVVIAALISGSGQGVFVHSIALTTCMVAIMIIAAKKTH